MEGCGGMMCLWGNVQMARMGKEAGFSGFLGLFT